MCLVYAVAETGDAARGSEFELLCVFNNISRVFCGVVGSYSSHSSPPVAIAGHPSENVVEFLIRTVSK